VPVAVARAFVVSPSASLRTGLSNHERLEVVHSPGFAVHPPSTLLRTGFDKLRANGDLLRVSLGE